MPLITARSTPIFELPHLSVTGLAAPSRGARENCVWRITLSPGAPGAEHAVDREEIFVAIAGRAEATLDGQPMAFEAGDALIVPPGVRFALANRGSAPFEAVAVLPVGGQAIVDGGPPFSPPWTR